MHIQRLIILLTFLFALIGASNVFANTHHHHHNGAGESKLASPFEKKQEGKSLHCLLNNHHRDGFCPHTGQPLDRSATQKISVECHGKEAGTFPSTSFQTDYFDTHAFFIDLDHSSSGLLFEKLSTSEQYLYLQDPPPKIVS